MTRLAICGLGNIGSVHLENLLSLPGCAISGVFDVSPAVSQRVGAGRGIKVLSSLDDLFGDPETDAVVIATPTETHLALATRSLAAGKHVFIEKPLAGTLTDAQAAVEAARNSSLCVQVGFCERFNPQYLEAKRHVEAGSLGAIRAIYTSRVAPYSLGNPNWQLGIFDTAVHNLDLILWLKKQPPVSVTTSGVQVYSDSPMKPDSATINMDFADGSLATDHITWLRDDAHPLHQCARSRMTILGDRGSFDIDLSQRPSTLLTADSFSMPDTVLLGGAGYYGCLKLQFEYFLNAIAGRLPVMAPAEDAMTAERLVLAAFDSYHQQKKVLLS